MQPFDRAYLADVWRTRSAFGSGMRREHGGACQRRGRLQSVRRELEEALA